MKITPFHKKAVDAIFAGGEKNINRWAAKMQRFGVSIKSSREEWELGVAKREAEMFERFKRENGL